MVAVIVVIVVGLALVSRLGQGSRYFEGGEIVGTETKSFIAFLQSQIGKPYLLGATGPDKWDCSSLVQAAYASLGVAVGRVVTTQAEGAPYKVPVKDTFLTADQMKAALRPGDAIGTGINTNPQYPPYPQYPTVLRYKHVGVWTGTKIIHASSSSGKVVEVPFSSWWFTEGRTIYAYPQN